MTNRLAMIALVLGLSACDTQLGTARTIQTNVDAATPGDAGVSHERDAYAPPLSSDHEITALVLTSAHNAGLASDVASVIDGTNIAIELPAGTSVSALVPSITFEGATISPANETAADFSAPVSYLVTADDGSSATYVVTVSVARDCSPTIATCDRTVYDRARAYAAANPTRDGGSWSGWCAALMVRFGGFSRFAPSAIAAYRSSSIISTDPGAAPIGAFHWWDIGEYGHVGVDLLGGGSSVFMASSHLAESWGTAIGVQSIGAYGAASGARYLGWSMDYIGQHIAGGGGAACGETVVPEGCPVPATDTQTTGVPDGIFWMRMQMYAAANGYTGPIDGVMGPHSWAGVQRGLRSAGYTGPDDGAPGTNTYAAMQRIAALYGYTGPVDGVLGPNSYRGFARFLNETL